MRILGAHRQFVVVTAALVLVTVEIAAQSTQTTTQTPTAPTFEVVSIKPHVGDTNSSSMRQMPDGGFVLVNGTARTLITFAYAGLVSEPIGLPSWVAGEHYDVNTTASLKNPTVEDRRAMMRAMLADRFNFVAHLETREQPSFELVLARKDGKLGPGLTPIDVDCAARAAEQRAALEKARAAGTPPPAPPPPTPPVPGSPVPLCGMRMMGNLMEGDTNVSGVAALIRPMAGRYVVDKTGLTGWYHLKLEVARMFQGPNPEPGATPDPADATTVFTALPEQLGLKLEPSRAQVEVLVIDRMERPSEN